MTGIRVLAGIRDDGHPGVLKAISAYDIRLLRASMFVNGVAGAVQGEPVRFRTPVIPGEGLKLAFLLVGPTRGVTKPACRPKVDDIVHELWIAIDGGPGRTSPKVVSGTM